MIKKIKINNLMKNILVILSGDGFAAIISLLCISLTIKTIGMDENGKMLMAQTYCMLFNDIFNFQSFNSIIKFMPEYMTTNLNKMKQIIKYSYFLELITAIIAFLFGNLLLSLIASFLNWNSDIINCTRIFIIYILFNLTGTSIGILRIYNKFKYISYNNIIINSIKLLLCIIGFINKFDMVYFLFIELIVSVFKNIILNISAFYVLHINKLNGWYKCKLVKNKEFFIFNLYSNLVSTLDLPIGHITSFIISSLLGFTELSTYKVFEKIAKIITKLCDATSQAIYPEISFIISQKKYDDAIILVRKIFLSIFTTGFLISIFSVITNKFWVGLFFENYNSKIIILLFIYFLVVTINNSFMGFNHLYTVMGYLKYSLVIIPIANIIYLVMLYNLTNKLSILGVIISVLLQGLMVVSMKYIVYKIKFKKIRLKSIDI